MKYKLYLYIILKLIYVSIKEHLEIIENLSLKIAVKEKKGLKKALEISKELYDANPVDENSINKYARTIQNEIVDYHYIRKETTKTKENIKKYNSKKMKQLLPENFLDSFYCIYLPILYIKDKLIITVKREKIEEQFNELLKLSEAHSMYIEKNYIEKFYEEAKVE